MPLLLTNALPFLAHDHPSAAAFLASRSHHIHGSIIPEFLSDDERVKSFCEARQQNQLEVDKEKQYSNIYNLFIQTPHMQFSPSLMLLDQDSAESILKPLLDTKYFTRSLQRCTVGVDVPPTNDLLQALSKVQSLTKLDLGSTVENHHLEFIVNSFPSLETLTIQNAGHLKIGNPSELAIKVSSPPPPATRTLRSLKLHKVDPLLAMQFIPHFINLTELVLSAKKSKQGFDLRALSSSLPRLKDMSLSFFTLENTESLANLIHLSSLQFKGCQMPDSLSFLAQENTLPHLTTLRINRCRGLSPSAFASLSHASNLHVLEVAYCDRFQNDCLQYLENMLHLRKLDLNNSITGNIQSLKTLMQNSFHQLEELNLKQCRCIGGKGAIAGALYNNTPSRLRVLNLSHCDLVDDDLNGIGALNNTLEVLYLEGNSQLTNQGLAHCKDLAKLKILGLQCCDGINDLSPLKGCVSLQDLNLLSCGSLTCNSFKAFGEDPNSFPNLRVLDLSECEKLKGKVFEHLSKNNHLVHRLNKLNVEGLSKILASSSAVRNNICQLKGLKRLNVCFSERESNQNKLEGELMRSLKNLEEVP